MEPHAVPKSLPEKIVAQMERAGLPQVGAIPFEPRIEKNRKGKPIIQKAAVLHGPKRGKKGFVDSKGRIWIRDRAHAGDPDHWDVQENGGKSYFRVDDRGELH
jgi:hypothetical protein